MTNPPSDNGNNKESGSDSSKMTPIAKEKKATDDHEQVLANAEGIDRLASTFESSARRWELIVYPSLFAFIILASYGFYLIFSLSHDIASMTRSITALTENVDRNMDIMANKVSLMSGNVDSMNGHIDTMSTHVSEMSVKMDNLDHMRVSMDQMNMASQSMARSTDSIQHTMGALNYNVGRPMSQMGSFMPW